jgi:hypothetical protein
MNYLAFDRDGIHLTLNGEYTKLHDHPHGDADTERKVRDLGQEAYLDGPIILFDFLSGYYALYTGVTPNFHKLNVYAPSIRRTGRNLLLTDCAELINQIILFPEELIDPTRAVEAHNWKAISVVADDFAKECSEYYRTCILNRNLKSIETHLSQLRGRMFETAVITLMPYLNLHRAEQMKFMRRIIASNPNIQTIIANHLRICSMERRSEGFLINKVDGFSIDKTSSLIELTTAEFLGMV